MEHGLMRRIFWVLNKVFMVPCARLGLLPLMGSPLSGWVMLLTTRGRKTGSRRRTPLNYALLDGNVYCVAGFGTSSHWYLNIQANARVETLLPSGPLAGRAEVVVDHAERLRAARQVLKNSGFAALVFEGINAFRVSDAELHERMGNYPVIRIQPTGVGCGAADPGGLSWVWWILVALVALIWVF